MSQHMRFNLRADPGQENFASQFISTWKRLKMIQKYSNWKGKLFKLLLNIYMNLSVYVQPEDFKAEICVISIRN